MNRMHRAAKAAAIGLTLFSAVAMAGCDIAPGVNRDGYRRVEGKLELPGSGILGRQNTGLQLAAVSVDIDGVPHVYASDTFNPAPRTGDSSFFLYSPDDESVFIVLQVPGAGEAGEYLGILEFSDGRGDITTIVPPGEGTINLGLVQATEGDPETVVDNRMSVDDGKNPLAQVDSDGDGQSDFIDADDDDDSIADGQDPDVAGDGIDDAAQTLESLPDEDGDGIPDLLDT